MALSFGVTVLPDPPASRLVELMKLGEDNGFEIGWTYDSHVLWQDSFPLLTLATQATSTDEVRAPRHQPGHARADRPREPLRDAARHLRRPHGDGDRPRRLRAPLHRPAAGEGGRVRDGAPDDQAVHERRTRCSWNDKDLQLKWVRPELPRDPDVGRRLRAEGARRRRARRRRRHHPARRSRDHPVDHGARPARQPRRRAATRRELKCIVCAPSHVGPIEEGREQTRWFPAMVSNHVMDLIERYGTDGSVDPDGAHRLRRRRGSSTTTTSTRASARRTASSSRTRSATASRCSATSTRSPTKLRELESIGVDHYSIYLMTHGQEETLAAYGKDVIPQFAGSRRVSARRPRSSRPGARVAAGWERRRALFWDATRPLSERMVELLDPQPGETILELAAGPGDTGFLAAERLGPGGRLLSTDVAPEMVDAARRRAAELGVTNADFRVLDAARSTCPTHRSTACSAASGSCSSPTSRPASPRWRVSCARAAGVDRRLGRAGAQRLDDRRRPGCARARADRAPRSRRARARSGCPIAARSSRSSLAAGLTLETLEDVPVDWHARSSTSGGRPCCDMSAAAVRAPRRESRARRSKPPPCERVRRSALEPYVAAGRSLTASQVSARVALARRPV